MELDGFIKRHDLRRFIDNGYVIPERTFDILMIKIKRRQIPFLMIDLVLVSIGKIKGLDRFTKSNALGIVDFLHHFLLTGIRILSGKNEFPQFPGVFAHKAIDGAHKASRMT